MDSLKHVRRMRTRETQTDRGERVDSAHIEVSVSETTKHQLPVDDKPVTADLIAVSRDELLHDHFLIERHRKSRSELKTKLLVGPIFTTPLADSFTPRGVGRFDDIFTCSLP